MRFSFPLNAKMYPVHCISPFLVGFHSKRLDCWNFNNTNGFHTFVSPIMSDGHVMHIQVFNANIISRPGTYVVVLLLRTLLQGCK